MTTRPSAPEDGRLLPRTTISISFDDSTSTDQLRQRSCRITSTLGVTGGGCTTSRPTRWPAVGTGNFTEPGYALTKAQLPGDLVDRSGRCVIDGVLERHDPRIEPPTAGQLQLEPPRRRLCGQQWNALTEQHGDHRDLDGIHEPTSRKLRKSLPPPNSQMSLPDFDLRSATTCSGLSETMVTFG